MITDKFREIGEYAASGAFEEPERSLFYRKALGIRRYYENCSLFPYIKGNGCTHREQRTKPCEFIRII